MHTTQALYYASIVYWLAGRTDKAREYLEKSLKSSPTPKVRPGPWFLNVNNLINSLCLLWGGST